MKSLKELLSSKRKLLHTRVAVACPEDEEVLNAIFEAYELGFCTFHLFGDITRIKQLTKKMGREIPKEFVMIEAKELASACQLAVRAISDGKADILMKGLVDTGIIMKEVLNKEYGIRTNQIISHVMVCELPRLKRLILLSDAAMIIDPTIPQMKAIITNAVSLAKKIGIINPKVAVISAIEKVNEKMPSTLKAKELQEMWEKGEITDCELYGPLAIDGALSVEAAKTKNISSPVAGNADILIVPYIEVGNALYKGWMFGCEGIKSAGIVMGAKAPIVLTSRADSHESKLSSIALAVRCLNNN
ncbi:MAG TPA: bifunctional enoyl-CoA hydratase/phosphate acetyltransferase [Bacilli bacterium]|jgi:phosphate butyryltransferase|nr:bifunctional enoyl-CoA hydratase/phosphate acetyltransferase [Acholeplasmataceae bacterium]HPY55239.1 bifunctional enoyl-CoA hydratase/phosphate acetyltransferase [Bacilli bacterium]HQB96205.1 bifunctional enoyl-CoA hydratase/phosphate acetyltransferase [Bacilli bacterium]HQO00452.1 bifunctional enoyl-CoA hydratase/phosphate acetyltransferase [Bacilli bacterium]HQP13835.1 bifunctional enoyl-CoA hydratase/phosphate acetyltransferase [Bacilli bacterium]